MPQLNFLNKLVLLKTRITVAKITDASELGPYSTSVLRNFSEFRLEICTTTACNNSLALASTAVLSYVLSSQEPVCEDILRRLVMYFPSFNKLLSYYI